MVVQVSMKQEMELAMKLLEKDIHEKQVKTCFPFFSDFPLFVLFDSITVFFFLALTTSKTLVNIEPQFTI